MTQYVGKGLTLLRQSQSKKAKYSLKNRWKWREKVTWSVKWRERVAPQPQAAGNTGNTGTGNTGSAWQRGRAITSSTILLGTVCLKRKSGIFANCVSDKHHQALPPPTNTSLYQQIGLSETQIRKRSEIAFQTNHVRVCLKRKSGIFANCVSDKPHVGKGLILLWLISWRRHRGKISKSNIRFRPTLT